MFEPDSGFQGVINASEKEIWCRSSKGTVLNYGRHPSSHTWREPNAPVKIEKLGRLRSPVYEDISLPVESLNLWPI